MSRTALATPSTACPVSPRQVRRAVALGRLPRYAEMLAAYHRAFSPELRRMVADAWPAGARQVLDLACGDGAYSAWLSELGGQGATVWAIDVSPDWLDVARGSVGRAAAAERVVTLAGDALRLPLEDDSFDFIWCAQSLYSLPDTAAVLAELRRVLRPGGRLAVLEDDTLHQVLLPWSAELELCVRRAELAAHRDSGPPADRYYIARQLTRLLAQAGFASCSKHTYAMNRGGPFSGDERTFLDRYLHALQDDVEMHLSRRGRAELGRFITPGNSECLLDDPRASVTFLDHVVSGTKG